MIKKVLSILAKPDYDEIRRVVREEVAELTSSLPSKKEYFETSDKMMVELKALREGNAAHMAIHDGDEKDIKNVTHKVKNLYKLFHVEEPADLVTNSLK